MQLPFSHEAFLDVFGRYNSDLWLVVAILWLATAAVAARAMASERVNGRLAFGLLAFHWAWSGLAYHWVYFRPINPAAAVFAAGFCAEAAALGWLAVRGHSRVRLAPLRSPRGLVGGVLAVYGLYYPFLGLAFGLAYPRLPLFAVPCPTTLVTAGALVAFAGVPRWVKVIPLSWAAIGGSAAFSLGIAADLALPLAGAVLALDIVAPGVLGRAEALPGTDGRGAGTEARAR